MAVIIQSVVPDSPASRAGIRAGDTLIAVNRHLIRDVLDYQFYATDARVSVEVMDAESNKKVFSIRKKEYEDLGLEFETYLMDKKQHCRNKCIFCFIDQMPKGMRETLYFKDDDDRLSFLFGNYVTLTNITPEEISRIIEMHISPINVSVHTTNPELRVKMMRNPHAGEVLGYLNQMAAHGIRLNTQLVLCPEINDGEELQRSLEDLGRLYPNIDSIAAVPVGLTDYREGLYPLRSFTKEEAAAVIDRIEEFSERFYQEHGVRIAYASDEFYLKAGRELPDYEYYGDFNQLENGVGLITSLRTEFLEALEDAKQNPPEELAEVHCSIATGELAYPLLCELAQAVTDAFPMRKFTVHRINNRFFGKEITVAGLVTGQDLIDQLRGKDLGEALLLPAVMLRHEQDKFLDDVTLEGFQQTLQIEVQLSSNDGIELLNTMLGCDEEWLYR